MALQASWVDHLFGRLQLRYGAVFLRQWPDTDIDALKADWADVLDGTSGDAISYALRYLPNTAPNAMAFRALCRAAPRPDLPALPAPDARANPDRVRSLLARLRAPVDGAESPAQQCARQVLGSVAGNRGHASPAQIAQLRAMWWLMTPEQRDAAAPLVPGLPLEVAA